MKRSLMISIAAALLSAILGGCVVVPAPGYYGPGYYDHHRYYYR